jgi:uridine kinase
MRRTLLLSKLAAAISAPQLPHPTRVAIDGVDGVGKTTLADELVAHVSRTGRKVIRASIDGFHNPRQQRYLRGPNSAEGYCLDSFNYEALKRELLLPLGPGGNGRYCRAVFDYRVDAEADLERHSAAANAVLLFDGVFLLRPELESHWDLSIWVDAPFELTVERAIQRDSHAEEPERLRCMYAQRYVPGQRIYLERCRPTEKAHIVVHNADIANPTLESCDD